MKIFEQFEKVNKTVVNIISAIALVTTALGVAFDKDEVTILSGIVILIIVIFWTLYNVLKQFYMKKNAMNSASLKRNAKRHLRTILKFEKAIRKKLVKHQKINEDKQQKLSIKKEISNLKKFDQEITHEKNTPKEKEVNISKKIKGADKNKMFEAAKLLNTCILSIEATLLQVEQYKARIKLGKFLVKYSFDTLSIQKGHIDLIGWSYMMMGQHLEGKNEIEAGINLIDSNLNENLDKQTKNASKLNKVRAYRHLGSSKHIFENDSQAAIAYNQKGLEVLKEVDPKLLSELEYEAMEVGLNYGILMSYYYHFKSKLKGFNAKEVDFRNFYNNVKAIEANIKVAKNFENNHRLIKLYLIKAKYEDLIHLYKDRFIEHVQIDSKSDEVHHEVKEQSDSDTKSKDTIENWTNKIDQSLTKAQDLFKKNIFNDDALDFYLDSQIKSFRYKLNELFHEGKKQ